MDMSKIYASLRRKIRAVVVSNDNDDRIWELCASGQKNIEIVAYMDVQSSKWGPYIYQGTKTDIRVVSVGKAIQIFQEGDADIFLIYSCRSDYDEYSFQSLNQFGIDIDKILFIPYEFVFHGRQISDDTMAEIKTFMERGELETIEIHAAEHCNLNCKFCSMFCGLVKKPSFPDYEKTKHGLEELKKYISHVKRVRIIGGEPLLNPDLEHYIRLVRRIYPFTDIRLITNGILAEKMSKTLISAIKENNVTFVVTGYEPLMNKHEEIHEFLENKGINHMIGNIVQEFQKIYDYRGNSDAAENYNACNWKRSCATLYEGRLSPCFPPFVIHYLCEEFHLNIPKSGIIDLYSENMSAQKIHSFFNTPFDLCRYCSDKRLFAKWERVEQHGQPKIEDWSA